MCNVLSSLAISLLLGAAPAPQPGSLAPTGVVVARAGQVLRIDGAGQRQVLANCEVRRRYKLVVEPFEERSETLPCSFSTLVSHEPTGRWAVGVSVMERQSNETEEYVVNGKALAIPARLGGTVFVLGDSQGVRGTSTGAKGAWFKGGKFQFQGLDEFSADGKLLFFTHASGLESESASTTRWQLPFEAPEKVAKAPPSEAEKLRARLAGAKGTVIVDGDDVFYYRKGKTFLQKMTDDVSLPQCDPAAPGTWRRLNRATGKDEEILQDGWCTAVSAPFVGTRPTAGAVVLNQLGQDRVRRLYRFDKASGKTAPIPLEGLAKTPMAVSADGAFVLAWTYRDGLAMHETATGALVWKAGALPSTQRNDDIEAAFVRDGSVALAHPERTFLGDGRAIPVGAGDPSLATSLKVKSFFERTKYGTAHVVAANGVHLAEFSSMDQEDVVARIRSDVAAERPGWSLMAAWPASIESGEVATIPVTEGATSGRCEPFATTDVHGGRVAFVDWHGGSPQVVACATSGWLRVRKNDTGGIELELEVTFDDGSWAKGFRLWLAPAR